MKLKIKYLSPLISLEKIVKGDWIDVRVSKVFVNGNEMITDGRHYKSGDVVLVKLGFAMELPIGYEAHILPRSSTFKNYGLILTNGMGVIDNSYCGNNDEWCMMFYALRDGSISKLERIGQFRIMESMEKIEWNIVDDLGNDNRGGYGSTGVK